MNAGPRADWSAGEVDGGRAVSDDEVEAADQGVGPPFDTEGGSEWSARETVQSDEPETGHGDEPGYSGESEAGHPDESEAGQDEASEGEAPEDVLEVACRQRDEYLDALRRLQADFENYRKRVQRQQDESLSRAAERLVSALLPALDAFDLAAAHLVGDEQASPGGLLQAVGLLRDTLAKEGLEQIGAAGDPFDPTAHEAVDHVDDDGGDGPTIDTVLRSGYRFGGRVVRPAMVKVRG
jgi:molecular chaperone GrpE